MGHDVDTIGNHKLDVSSMEALALDISRRFKANVEYGYYDQHWVDLEGNEVEPSYENIIFEKILYPGSEETLWLSDELYRIHQLLNKYGDTYINLPIFNNDTAGLEEEFESAMKGVSYELRSIDNEIDYGTIYNDTFHNHHSLYCYRWFNFCRNFMDPDGYRVGNLDDLNEYRKEIFKLHKLIGGSAVVHLDDQGQTQYLTYGEHTWQEILNELNTSFKCTTINISEFMKHKMFLPQDKFPLAFYDDFGDLKLDKHKSKV